MSYTAKLRKWVKSVPVAVLLVGSLALAGCPADAPVAPDGELSGSMTIIGSNTVVPIITLMAEEFMEMHPQVTMAVSGPGSGVGIAAMIDGLADISMSSREMRPREIEQARANGINPHEIAVALDALAVVVHPDNPVSELTMAQISDIFTNTITNWKEVGGNDAPIVVLSRDTASGTHVYFKEAVVQMEDLPTEDETLEFGPDVLFLPSTKMGVDETARNPNAIFYPGLGYVTDDVKTIGVKMTDQDTAVWPSVATALDGTYPISRSLFLYTDGEPTGIIEAFIDYALSPEGQENVAEVGFVPLPEK